MEHWLPLFHEKMSTLFDYIGGCGLSLDHLAEEAARSRLDQISEYFDARKEALDKNSFGAAPYKPLATGAAVPDVRRMERPARCPARTASLAVRPATDCRQQAVRSMAGEVGRSFAAERATPGANVFDAVRLHIDDLRNSGKRVVIAAWTEGAASRLETILKDHGVAPIAAATSWAEVQSRPGDVVSTVVLGLEHGFETADIAVIAEQDILGDRLVRRAKKSRRAGDFIAELSSVSVGDLVVHVDHGIGRFEGLRTILVQNAPHDCLFLQYAAGDRLFLPVENIELLSRYGSDVAGVELDRLGSGSWQARKARMKERVREIADALIRTAAARAAQGR